MAENLAITEFTTEELGDLLGFEPEEVKENRAGKITNRQLKRMRVMSLIGLVFAPIGFYNIYNNFSIVMTSWCIDSCKLLSFGRGMMSILLVFLCLGLVLRLTLWQPKVSSKAGILNVKGGFFSAFRWYPIQVKDKKLSIGWATKRIMLPKGITKRMYRYTISIYFG